MRDNSRSTEISDHTIGCYLSVVAVNSPLSGRVAMDNCAKTFYASMFANFYRFAFRFGVEYTYKQLNFIGLMGGAAKVRPYR